MKSVAEGSLADTDQVDDDAALKALFGAHFRELVVLASLVGSDDPENVAQEAFVRLSSRLHRLREPSAAKAYLRTTVINLTRHRFRHLSVVRRHPDIRRPPAISAEDEAIKGAGDEPLNRALSRLPSRQREALVLRYWLDMTEKEMAEAMNVSPGSVKTHLSRGLSALRNALPEHGGPA